MDNHPNFKWSTEHEVIPHPPQKMCIIPFDEWGYLKRKMSQMILPLNWFHTIGTLLLGSALTGILTALMVHFTHGNSIVEIITWSYVIITGILGGGSIYFAKWQQKIQSMTSDDIFEYMKFIEQRYIQEQVTEESDNLPVKTEKLHNE